MTTLLQCQEITVRFGGVTAVDEVSLSVEGGGEVVGLIGPNGSGKTTFLNAISGIVPASRGNLRVEGQPVRLGRPARIARQGIFRTFQTPQVDPGATCIDNVLVASTDYRFRGVLGAWPLRPWMLSVEKERWRLASRCLDLVGLLPRANQHAAGLAYGERRRLEIARAMMAKPRLLLLDEPAAGLNSAETHQLAELLATITGEGVSLIVIEHKIAFIERLCHRVVVLELGRQIAEGRPSEVWHDPAVVDAYLGEAV